MNSYCIIGLLFLCNGLSILHSSEMETNSMGCELAIYQMKLDFHEMKNLHRLFCNKENDIFMYVKKKLQTQRQEDASSYPVRRSFVICSDNTYQAIIKQPFVVKRSQTQNLNITALIRLTRKYQQIAWFDFNMILPSVSTISEVGIINRFGIRLVLTYRSECTDMSDDQYTDSTSEDRLRWTAKDRRTRETSAGTFGPKLISQTNNFVSPSEKVSKNTDFTATLQNLLRQSSTLTKLFTVSKMSKISLTSKTLVLSTGPPISSHNIGVLTTPATLYQNNFTNTLSANTTEKAEKTANKTNVTTVPSRNSTSSLVTEYSTVSKSASSDPTTIPDTQSPTQKTITSTTIIKDTSTEPITHDSSSTTMFLTTTEHIVSSDDVSSKSTSFNVTSDSISTSSYVSLVSHETNLRNTTVHPVTTTPVIDTTTSESKVSPLTQTPERNSHTLTSSPETLSTSQSIESTMDVKSSPTGNTLESNNITPNEEKDNDESFWPAVVGLVIGLPAVIVFGIAITVIHRKRSTKIPRLTASDLRNAHARSVQTNISR